MHAIVVTCLIYAAVLLLLATALHDLAVRTIPHTPTAALAAIGAGLRLADHSLPASLLIALAVLLASLALCLRGYLGGGDVKLLAAVALLLPPAQVPAGLTAIALAGALLALPYILLRRRLTPPRLAPPAARRLPAGPRLVTLAARCWRAERFRLRRGGPLPYGIGIAAGGILMLLRA